MKMNKKLRRILLTVCSAALLVCVTVGATVAYLTSTATVTNSFTIGNVTITLDEADTDLYGNPVTAVRDTDGKITSTTPANSVAEATRGTSNTYKLMPGHSYTKDPTVHVAAGSENSWLFVKVENGIANYEATDSTYTTIANQIATKGWTALTGVDNVYYKQYTSQDTVRDEVVFENFKIADSAQDVNGWSNINTTDTKITITAYAVQKDGFDTADAAWTATFGKPEGE